MKLVACGDCQGYLAVLVAPSSYLKAVPPDEAWHCMIAVEEIASWFGATTGSHGAWRALALTSALDRSKRNVSPDNAHVVKFSAELAAYLDKHYAPSIWHNPGKDRTGPILRFPGSSEQKTLWWKYSTNQMTLQLMYAYEGLAESLSLPAGIALERASDFSRKCDYLVVPVPPVDLTIPFEDQLATVEAAIQAALRLIARVPLLDELARKRGAT